MVVLVVYLCEWRTSKEKIFSDNIYLTNKIIEAYQVKIITSLLRGFIEKKYFASWRYVQLPKYCQMFFFITYSEIHYKIQSKMNTKKRNTVCDCNTIFCSFFFVNHCNIFNQIVSYLLKKMDTKWSTFIV